MPAAKSPDVFEVIDRLPELLRENVSLWLARLAELRADPLAEIIDSTISLEGLLRFVAVSDFAAQHLLRDWDWFVAAARDGDLGQAPQPAWGSLSQDATEAEFKQQLRRLRNRGLLHILWRDLHGAELADTLGALSRLADNLIAAAEGYARRELTARFGDVRDADGQIVPLVILAMGKLGGRELNFSSDVDLIFLYAEDGDSDGSRSLTAQEYFARLARRIVALLEEATADGFVYRVDTRLRPFGDSGPPVVSFAALEAYLLNHGRSWERYAWIKARTVVPAVRHAAVVKMRNELIDPFVYRRYLDYSVFEALREMKEMVSAEVRRREMADNVKLGPGGIREIEFIVQSLQLVRGGNVRGLRTRQLRVALLQLQELRGLEPAAAKGLLAAYDFLRRLENFIQAMRDQQVHDLPDNEPDRARVALAMGYPDWQSLATETARQQEFVSEQFNAVAFRTDTEPAVDSLNLKISALSEGQADAASWQQLFAEFGFNNPGDLSGALTRFLDARSTREAGATALQRLHRLLPAMLSELRELEQPLRTFERLSKIVTQVLRRSAYLSLLNENRFVLGRLVELCAKSGYLADEVARYPLLLDEMLAPGQYAPKLNATVFRDDLTERLVHLGDTDSERRIEVLARFQRAMLFRIAAADFLGDMNVMKVSDRLTELAEVVLEQALEIAWRDLAARFGEPRFAEHGQNRQAGMGVIAYGKLGGIELSYGSDLDLVFLHDSRGESQRTNGASELDNGMFFVRLARRLTHFLTTQTASGALYEVDTRLRPSGKSGLLVSSVDAFERYQHENAWTWEHQALLRARPVAGHPGVAREFERIRAGTLTERVNRASLREEVLEMREKMRAQLDKSNAEQFDLKQGAGGIGDIEFLVQYLVLQNAGKFPAVIHYPDNIRQLGTLGAAGCLGRDDVSSLQEIYRSYRRRLHKLLLNEGGPFSPLSEFGAERKTVIELWRRLLEVPAGQGPDQRG
ncbi:MAG: bifunctional [glutamate--ammonia ligase]-adenylyl-L-tyrosine phosphorylase/[glutamate--ammonia-ligase] adenylyltransferase [Woeseia sp.]